MAIQVAGVTARLGFDIPAADRREAELYERKLDEFRRLTARRDAFKARLGADYNPRAFNAMERDLKRNARLTDDNVRSQGRLRTAFGSVSSAGIGMFAAAGGGYAVYQGLKQVVTAAGDAEASLSKVRTMVTNAGINFNKHADQIDRTIQAHSRLSGFDDEELAESFGNMIRTTKDLNEAFRLNAIAADVARTKGTDLAGAQSLVARVANGSFMGLKRLGLSIEPVTRAQDRLKESTKEYTTEQMRSAVQSDKTATARKAVALLEKTFAGQAEAYGKTQMGAIDRLKVAWENLQEVLGQKLAPTITDLANKAARFVTQMTEGTGAGGRFVDTMKDAYETLKDVGGALVDIGGFLKDHIDLIKIAAGAWVGYKVAALGAAAAGKGAAALSVLTGGRAGGGAAGRLAGGAAAGGIAGSVGRGALLGGRAGLIGAGVGAAGAGILALRGNIEDKNVGALADKIERLVSTRNLDGLREMGRRFKEYDSFSGGIDKARNAIEDATKSVEEMQAATGRSTGEMRRSFNNLKKNTVADMDDINDVVRRNMKRIRNNLDTESDEGRAAIAENFRKAAQAVRRQVRNKVIDTRDGMKAIRSFLAQELEVYGLSLKQARNIASGVDRPGSKRDQRYGDVDQNLGREGGGFRQQGGWLGSKGQIGSDTIQVAPGYWAAPGEYYAKGPQGHGAVINRHQAPIVNLALMRGGHTLDSLPRDSSALPTIEAALRDFGGLDAVFSSIRKPHMLQGGGIVELLHPGNDPRGHGDHLHVAMSSYKAIVALGRRLQKLGWLVGEHPAFGSVGGHAAGSYHYRGQAIDVNWPNAGAEPGKIAALLPMLGQPGMGGLAPAKPVPRQRITGGGAVGRAAQGALDLARAGAQRMLDSAGSAGASLASSGGGSAGANKALARRLLGAYGWGPDQFPALETLWQGESGWNENAVNPSSGAGGIPQALPASKMGAGWQGNALQQIRWGLGYIKGRYGSPSRALSFWNAQSPHWYQSGGRWGGSPFTNWRRATPAKGPFRSVNYFIKQFRKQVAGRNRELRGLITKGEGYDMDLALAGITPSTSDDLASLRNLERVYQRIVNQALKYNRRDIAAQYAPNLISTREQIADLLAPGAVDDSGGLSEVIRPPSPEEIAQGVASQMASFQSARSSLFSSYGSNFTLAGGGLGLNSTLGQAAGLRNFGVMGGQASQPARVINQTNVFPTPPPEPHHFARLTLFDLQAAP